MTSSPPTLHFIMHSHPYPFSHPAAERMPYSRVLCTLLAHIQPGTEHDDCPDRTGGWMTHLWPRLRSTSQVSCRTVSPTHIIRDTSGDIPVSVGVGDSAGWTVLWMRPCATHSHKDSVVSDGLMKEVKELAWSNVTSRDERWTIS